MTRAFLFAGQGSQKTGMGMDLQCQACRAHIQAADSALGFALTDIMANGPEEKLDLTRYAQPAIVCLSVTQSYHLQCMGVQPDVVAGHSVGLYSALVVAGALEYEDALRLVAERGRLMQETVPQGRGGMMAIVGLECELVYQACEQARAIGIVDVACHNCPGQTVISGECAAVESAAALCEEQGAGVVPLNVSVPFHCKLLAPMLPEFARLILNTPVQEPEIPVICDITARVYESTAEIRESLVEQITSPVLFEECINLLLATGTSEFIQCGPGKSLVNFVQRVSPHADVKTFDQAMLALA